MCSTFCRCHAATLPQIASSFLVFPFDGHTVLCLILSFGLDCWSGRCTADAEDSSPFDRVPPPILFQTSAFEMSTRVHVRVDASSLHSYLAEMWIWLLQTSTCIFFKMFTVRGSHNSSFPALYLGMLSNNHWSRIQITALRYHPGHEEIFIRRAFSQVHRIGPLAATELAS